MTRFKLNFRNKNFNKFYIEDVIFLIFFHIFLNIFFQGKKPQNAEQVRDLAEGCMRIRGEKLGIVGLGNIGTAVALRAKVFGFDVLYYDPKIPDGKGKALGITKVGSLQELLYGSDCVSIHCALNDQTKFMFNEFAFNKMRKVNEFFLNLFCIQIKWYECRMIRVRNETIL
jgi:phosphoglycerate dehydrogenase-like enzyme